MKALYLLKKNKSENIQYSQLLQLIGNNHHNHFDLNTFGAGFGCCFNSCTIKTMLNTPKMDMQIFI